MYNNSFYSSAQQLPVCPGNSLFNYVADPTNPCNVYLCYAGRLLFTPFECQQDFSLGACSQCMFTGKLHIVININDFRRNALICLSVLFYFSSIPPNSFVVDNWSTSLMGRIEKLPVYVN